MNLTRKTSALLATLLLVSCAPEITQVSSTNDQKWVSNMPITGEVAPEAKSLTIDLTQTRQTVTGFGACFNELGWQSLSRLTDAERQTIMKELFAPNTGANFNICRMPLGANDFSLDWYSYNETEGDFEMKNFSIDNDRKTLIPFIKNAQQYNPELEIWASPWCPPQWLKYNKHYASRSNNHDPRPEVRNNLPVEREGAEGTDMFIQEEAYLEAYALYFQKFIQAYGEEKIDIFAVMPQNEFNSDQVFPSCCWTAKGLANFIGKHLGPKMEAEGVDVMFGTMERPNHLLVDTIIKDADAGKYIKGIGFQWAGKQAIAALHKAYPEMPLYQTEQECGNGKNDWQGAVYSWSLMKHYFDNGTSAYMYWNISLDQGGISRWGWAQNSLVVVDPATKAYQFTNEYYLLKHLSHYVPAGSKYLALEGDAEALAFLRPDGKVVVMMVEKEGVNRQVNVTLNGEEKIVTLPANSINTVVL